MAPELRSGKVLLIVNPHAGMLRLRPALMDILDLYCRNDKAVTVYVTKARGDATAIVRQCASQFGTVVCCGGDGTLNEVITGLMEVEDRPTLGYIPAGTTNDFASSMKLSTNLLEATGRTIRGEIAPIDIGLFNQKYFSYIASFGAFTESSYATPQHVKNVLGHIAYVLEGVKDIPNIRPYHVRIRIKDVMWEDDFLFGCVSNSTSIAGLVKLNEALVDMRDGKFEVMLIRNPRNAHEAQKIVTGILSQQFDGEIIRFFTTEEIEFYPDERIPWSLDGEYEAGTTAIRIRNLPGAIRIRI